MTPVERVNYIRNSVKATVDAYNGKVTLYQWDEQDPVLKTWMKAFPGTVKTGERDQRRADGAPALPRGPVQGAARAARELPRRPAAGFYSGSDFWRVPVDPTSGDADAGLQPPYYLTLQMPGPGRAGVLADLDLRADR